MLSHVRVRKTVLSSAAVCEDGFFNNNMLLIETERAMMRAGKEVIVVADSSKFGNQSLGHVCALGTVDYVVVDSQAQRRMAEQVDRPPAWAWGSPRVSEP